MFMQNVVYKGLCVVATCQKHPARLMLCICIFLGAWRMQPWSQLVGPIVGEETTWSYDNPSGKKFFHHFQPSPPHYRAALPAYPSHNFLSIVPLPSSWGSQREENFMIIMRSVPWVETIWLQYLLSDTQHRAAFSGNFGPAEKLNLPSFVPIAESCQR